MNRFRSVSAVFALLAACACSSSDEKKGTSPEGEKYLGLSQPTDGFQVRSLGMAINPGEDIEYCEVAELPGKPTDTYYVNSIEFANAASSHHLIIDMANPGGPAEEKLAGKQIGDRVECISTQSQFGDGFEFVGGTQTRYQRFDYPAGVGRVYHGGQRFVFDYHYLNTTEEAAQAKSAVNFHLTDEKNIVHIAQIFNFNNVTIDTPAGETGSFMGECRVNQEIILAGLTRHTHRWGTDYSVWYAGGAHDSELVFSSSDYEHDVDHRFSDPITVKAGEGFRFQCDYDNTEAHALRFGPNATDEMCILFGSWWIQTDGVTPTSQDCTMTQVGTDRVARPVSLTDFPKPTPEEVTACLNQATSKPSTQSPACSQCACDTCAAVINTCVNDPDCMAIFECVNQTGCSEANCAGVCGDVINAHSPGTGSLIQLAQCIGKACPTCNQAASADGGTP